MKAFIAAGASLVLAVNSLSDKAASGPQFRNLAAQSGIDFVLENSPTERKHLPETMAGGIAVFDYDGDGWPDIFFANGAAMPSLKKESPRHYNRLYRNAGNWKFRDVTAEAGLAGEGYSIAAAAGDFDNDGRIDLFVGGVRHNRLYRNLGGGRFRDVTAAAGIASGLWCEGAIWFDYDNDGRLDLFVVNYLQWTPEFDTYCGDAERKIRAYCHPRLFEGLPNTLYRNRGDGTFEDVSRKSGIAAHIGKGMSAAAADYDNDGFLDVYVTNDKTPNFLFHNKGNGTFEEAALVAGGALQDSGMAASAMGVDFRDYNNDGLPDIAFTALAGETFPLFVNTAKAEFRDAGHLSGMAKLSQTRSGWAIGLFDFDNNGWKDAFTANSHVNDTVASFEAAQYKLTNSVFSNIGGKFHDATAGSGLDREPPRAHRGAAFA
ncbi:MAG TPA: VCBS repeat-containing protein, partial [Bryobacteraceae bacterium]|nr:VCBS repeat-containing protein [Bryobacteraceae bacterium]